MRRAVVTLLLLVLAGCHPPQELSRAYNGPTDDLPAVLQHVNERNTKIVSLQADGGFRAELIDPKTKDKTNVDGDISIGYLPPQSLLLVGKVLGDRQFTIGSNAEHYWLSLKPADTMWWGERGSATYGGRDVLPIRPDLFTEVIGITPLDPDLLKQPVPTLRFNNDQDCYMVTWNIQLADHWATQKEIWYDRQTLMPRVVVLFDSKGRIVLRAYMWDPKNIEGYSPPLAMPSVYDMYFPDSGSKFRITLEHLRHDYNGAPNARFFVLPTGRSGMSNEQRIDR